MAANTGMCYWKLEGKSISTRLVSCHWCEEDNLVKCFTVFLIKPTIYKISNPLLQVQIKKTTLKEEEKIYFQTAFLFINTINSWLFAPTSWQKLDNATLQISSYLFVTPFDGFISCHPIMDNFSGEISHVKPVNESMIAGSLSSTTRRPMVLKESFRNFAKLSL